MCTFFRTSCAVIILNGDTSSALVYFLIECWYTSCCCSEISVGLKYFCVTHRVHFFLPHRVQLLFSNGAPSCAPVYFYSEVGMLHFAAVTVSWEWVKPQKDIISDKSITNEEKAEKISKVIPEALDNYLRFYAVRLIKSNNSQEQKLLVLLH